MGYCGMQRMLTGAGGEITKLINTDTRCNAASTICLPARAQAFRACPSHLSSRIYSVPLYDNRVEIFQHMRNLFLVIICLE